MFTLDKRLREDTIDCGSFDLCRALLMNDSRYPWIILVPQREGITEIHHLSKVDQRQLWKESRELSLWMEDYFSYEKLNVAALGNVVSQLHLHHVGRSNNDPAWPGPVWGHSPAIPYDCATSETLKQALATLIGCKT